MTSRFPPGAIVRRDLEHGPVWRVVCADGTWAVLGKHPESLSPRLMRCPPRHIRADAYDRVPDDEVPEEVWIALAKLRLMGHD